MQIDPHIAQEIVISMKEIINQEINIFSDKGVIIASTDEDRVGESHGGAKKVIEICSPIVIEYDGQFGKTTKKGINIPLYFDDHLIGVVGITGKKKDVAKFGKMIKRMTEILIRENISQELLFNRRNINSHIIDYILDESITNYSNSDSFKLLFDINLDIPRYAIIGNAKDRQLNMNVNNISHLFSDLDSLLGNNNENIFDIYKENIVILLDSKSDQSMKYILKTVARHFSKSYNIDFNFGIGLRDSGVLGLRKSLYQANKSLMWGGYSEQLSYYPEIKEGIILTDITINSQQDFIKIIFNNLSIETINDICSFINIYEKNNGSINKCADELFIHKNTVQYKLKKIKKQTGLDPRQLSDFFLLKLACTLVQSNPKFANKSSEIFSENDMTP